MGTYINNTGYLWEVAPETTPGDNTQGTMVGFGYWKGDPSWSDSRASSEADADFSNVGGTGIKPQSTGGRSRSLSMTSHLVLDDEAFLVIYTAYKTNRPAWVRRLLTDQSATAQTWETVDRVLFTEFTQTTGLEAQAEYACNCVSNELVTDDLSTII